MKIGIDARFLGSRSKGLGRYTEQLIRNIEACDPQDTYVIFLRKENWDEWNPVHKGFKKVLADFQWYSLEEQVRFPAVLKKEACDIYHFPHFNVPLLAPKPFVVTIHDLILSHFPTVKATTLGPALYWIKNLMYRLVMRHALRASAAVISVSQFTKQDLLKTYCIPNEKISVTYEGIHLPQLLPPFPSSDSTYSYYRISKPYLLYVGNAYPHKNLEFLIDGFSEMRKSMPELSLVLVGAHDFFYKRIISYAEERGIKNIVFPGFVPDADLHALYEGASCYVFPSLYEGFGLPPLEAMTHSVPVVSSNASCMPEILGSAAAYFSPHDVRDMIQAITKVLSDVEYRNQIIKNAQKQIVKYSWKKMAQETMKLYESIETRNS